MAKILYGENANMKCDSVIMTEAKIETVLSWGTDNDKTDKWIPESKI